MMWTRYSVVDGHYEESNSGSLVLYEEANRVEKQLQVEIEQLRAELADLQRRLTSHGKGEGVVATCLNCGEKYWYVDDEPIICPFCKPQQALQERCGTRLQAELAATNKCYNYKEWPHQIRIRAKTNAELLEKLQCLVPEFDQLQAKNKRLREVVQGAQRCLCIPLD